MKALKLHFEQIPVEMVKRIAKELPEDAIKNKDMNIETQEEVVSLREPWREVAQRVREERDPVKMIALVETLITKLDEEQIRKRLPQSQS